MWVSALSSIDSVAGMVCWCIVHLTYPSRIVHACLQENNSNPSVYSGRITNPGQSRRCAVTTSRCDGCRKSCCKRARRKPAGSWQRRLRCQRRLGRKQEHSSSLLHNWYVTSPVAKRRSTRLHYTYRRGRRYAALPTVQ